MLRYILITERIFGGMDIEQLTAKELRIRAKDMGRYQAQIESLLDVPNARGSIERIGDYMIIVTIPL